MYYQIEAHTWMGIRRFLIAADNARAAAQEMTALLERGARLMDESGEWFHAFEIDPETLETRGAQQPSNGAMAAHYTNDGQRMV